MGLSSKAEGTHISRLLVNNSEKMPHYCLGIIAGESLLLAAGNRL
jgi:hypothetical protein